LYIFQYYLNYDWQQVPKKVFEDKLFGHGVK